jgi:hypothetical protein
LNKAEALHERNEPYRGDIAFNTQPGHIPERARALRRTEKAWKHEAKAREHLSKAAAYRSGVRVKGDAKRKRAELREKMRPYLAPGVMVKSMYGIHEVQKVNSKTVR